MPHEITHMDECADSLMGNATSGYLADLKTAYHAVNALLDNNPEPPGAHDLLNEIQAWLCDGGTYQGAAAQAKAYIDACNAFL